MEVCFVCAVFVRLRLPVKSSLTSMLQNGESRCSYICIKMSIDFKMHRNTSKQVSLFIRSRFRYRHITVPKCTRKQQNFESGNSTIIHQNVCIDFQFFEIPITAPKTKSTRMHQMCIDFQNGFVDDTSGPSLTGWMTEKGEGSKGGDSNFSPVEPEFTVTPLTLHLNGKYVLNFLILRV